MAMKGLKSHIARLKKLPGIAERNVTKALFGAAELIGNAAAKSITAGAVSGKNHEASKPGQAPNADTHVLDRSIEAVRAGKLKARVQVLAPYATALEKGTSRMAERPYLGPARDKNRNEARKLVADGLNAALKQARTNAG